MFIGREEELLKLERLYAGKGFKFIVISGARGSGKSTLIEKFCEGKDAVHFIPASSNNRANLYQFSQLLFENYVDGNAQPFQFWDTALSYVAEKQKGERIILAIDDVDKLAARDLMLPKVLAHAIDNVLETSDIFLIAACADDSAITQGELKERISKTVRIESFLNERTINALQKEELKRTKIHQAKFFHVPADSTVISEGSMNDDIYKIISGRAVCYVNYGKPDEYILGSLKEGRTFGEYSVLTGEAGIYTVVAFSDMLLLRISRSEFENFITLNAGNSTEIMKNMAGMLKVMRYGLKMLGEEMQEQN